MKSPASPLSVTSSTFKNGTIRSKTILFAKNFLKHPRMLGSIVPSSSFLMNRMLREVDWSQARTFVEFGPGIGNFTAEILKQMRPDANLVVFETNPEFADFLRSSIRDPRLHVIPDSAEALLSGLRLIGLDKANYVLSGIPFSTMPESTRRNILSATRSTLCSKGSLLVYQFSPAVLPFLESEFSEVRRDFELLNILPAHLFYCRP